MIGKEDQMFVGLLVDLVGLQHFDSDACVVKDLFSKSWADVCCDYRDLCQELSDCLILVLQVSVLLCMFGFVL